MGRDKATLPFGDEVMLTRVIRLLGEVVEPIVVVASPSQQLPPIPDRIQIARDRHEGRGPLEGLATGLTAIARQADAIYATSCDVPLLQPQFVRRLFQRLSDDAENEIIVPHDGKFHHPLAAVYRTTVLTRVESLLAAGRRRPLFLFDIVRSLRVSVDDLRDVDPGLETLENLNRPKDYIDALERAGFKAPASICQSLGRQVDEGDSVSS